MKNLKRKIAAALAVITAISCFAGCTKTAKNDENQEVTLKYLMSGPGKQADSEKVWAAFNEKLAQDVPGVKMDFEVIPLSEYNQKFMLMNSAREKIDIANNYSLDFPTEVRNGTFEPLDELLQEYGKETLAALPEWFMDYQKVDGKIYGIPSYQMCAALRAVVFFKDEAEQFLDMDAFKEALYSTNTWDNQKVYDILEKYMADLKAAGYNYRDASILNNRGYESITGHYGVEYGKETEVQNFAINNYAKMRYKVASDWYKKGYIRSDIISVTDRNYYGKKDGYAFWDEVYTPFQEKILSEKYDKPVIMVPYDEKDYIGYQNSAKGTSILAKCEDKVKAMKVLNLLQTDKDYFNLLCFGIEGEHYTKTGEDSIEVPYQNPSANDKYGLWKWILGNTSIAYNIQTEPAEYKTWVFEESNKSDFISPLIGFNLDTTKIADYITQVNAVNSKYYQALCDGALEDWEASFKAYEEELNRVGNQQIMEEIQNQLDEFYKNK